MEMKMIFKKMIYLGLLISIILSLTACSASGETAQPSADIAPQNHPQPPADMVVESKLAIGILKLEGTQNAVTSDQAKTMLPLWQAVKSLGKTTNTTDIEMNALYQQIEDTLTAEQLQAIKDLGITPDDQKALMEQYGIQIPRELSGNFDPNQMATRIASRSSEGGSILGGGPGSGMGGAGGFAAGGPPGAASNQENIQAAPQAEQFSRGEFRSGMNMLFADSLIKLLEKRASS